MCCPSLYPNPSVSISEHLETNHGEYIVMLSGRLMNNLIVIKGVLRCSKMKNKHQTMYVVHIHVLPRE